MSEREELGRKIVDISQSIAEGYLRGITSFSTEIERAANEKCAIAASNTGWFILDSLGFSNDEKRAFVNARKLELAK